LLPGKRFGYVRSTSRGLRHSRSKESTLDVGEGDSAFVEQMILAYDTERRLQTQGFARHRSQLRPSSSGPTYLDDGVERVGGGISAVAAERVNERSPMRRPRMRDGLVGAIMAATRRVERLRSVSNVD